MSSRKQVSPTSPSFTCMAHAGVEVVNTEMALFESAGKGGNALIQSAGADQIVIQSSRR
ncbi:MAG: hypothetical protein U1E15_09310 [Hyphomicrobiales bacterium]